MKYERRRWAKTIVVVFVTAMLAGCTWRTKEEEAEETNTRPTIVFMTDFGTANDAVAICKGVINILSWPIPKVTIVQEFQECLYSLS